MSNKSVQNAITVSNTIAAAISVLNGITPLTIQKQKNISYALNPFSFITGMLQPIVGYNEIVNFITELIVNKLQMIEDTMKSSLIGSLKDLFSCSVNPLINDDLINKGIVLNLKSIDLLNVINHPPLVNKDVQLKIGNVSLKLKTNGSFFYFGVDKYTVPEEIIKCEDLNAVIWYVKQHENERVVWYGYQTQSNEHETLTITTKPSAENGIITLEYLEKSSMLSDAQNNPLSVQVPYDNCLHVFLGNTKGVTHIPEPSTDDLVLKRQGFQKLIEELSEVILELKNNKENTSDIETLTELQNDIDFAETILATIEEGNSINTVFPDVLIDNNTDKYYFTIGNNKIYITEYTYTHNTNDLISDEKTIKVRNVDRNNSLEYRTPQQNYYYGKTLFQFNADYINSVKFFDTKVITTQIINALTGCFGATINLSFEERLIRNETEKLLTKIIESDDVTVNDCFFSFNNDDYNLMVDETEKERIGEYAGNDYAYGAKFDYNTIYDELNKVSASATKSEQISTINGAMYEISRTLQPEEDGYVINYEANVSFLTNMLKGLALALVYGIISPKIYILIAINLKIMGNDSNFDLTNFIEQFKNLLLNVIRSITNKILEEMKTWLLSLTNDLARRVADRLMLEQAEYHTRLLIHCINSFKKYFGSENWNMADVEYADIYSEENNGIEPENNIC